MAAIIASACSHFSNLTSKVSIFSHYSLNQREPMFTNLLFFFFFSAFSISFTLSFVFLYKLLGRSKRQEQAQTDPSAISRSLSKIIDGARKARENGPTHGTRSLLLDIVPSDSSRWSVLFEKTAPGHGEETDGPVEDSLRGKKKKKRAKKKRLDLKNYENDGEDKVLKQDICPGLDSGHGRVKPELVCLYPFTSTSSAIQRRIKHQYDQLVKCNESKELTLAQVGEFANCLIEARNELQHKSEVIKRKFTITKALLFKADRSSVDRLSQQIYKLELEQKRLEDDAFVYNWLQQQLKLSPAYKRMLEISTHAETKPKPDEATDSDTEVSDISFEELLAQEKKDSFWQKNRRSKYCSG
ncbi:hypothetical protein K2173_024681 [Erythroxylum novogranatense]|uniref:AT1G17665-like protein n=1 Tax=Erythroxylum novogranatense TaxID=1862640 RepID=A0AAV8SWA7_9ROSI|nr:hypothetical protein K2173_024681 [Erythroxylum novogranatense]